MIINDQPTAVAIAANDNDLPDTVERDVKQLMQALTRLLVGPRGDPHGAAFNATMMVIVGAPLATGGLLWLADLARLNRRHVVHLSFAKGCAIPQIVLAYRRGDAVAVYEQCYLVLEREGNRVTIVPDSFRDGAFRLSSDMRLKRRQVPSSFEAALPMIKRAYERFEALLAAVPAADTWQPIRISRR